jgi:hypothetical protein
MEMGALLAILFRLSSTFELIANTQRKLRRTVQREPLAYLPRKLSKQPGPSQNCMPPPSAASGCWLWNALPLSRNGERVATAGR